MGKFGEDEGGLEGEETPPKGVSSPSKVLLQHRNRVGNGLFERLLAVLVNLGFVLFAVRQTTRTANATADTSHTFNEVRVQFSLALLQKRNLALLNAVAGAGLQQEVNPLLFQTFRNRIGQSAATRKDSAEIRRIVQNAFFQHRDINITAVKERLQFLKGHCRINIRADTLLLYLHLLCGARTDKDRFAARLMLFEVLCNGRHRGEVVRNKRLQIREVLVDVVNKSGTAGAGQESLFGKLAGLCLRHHIGAQRRLNDGMKSEFAQARNHLPELCIGELARNRRRNNGINLIVLALVAVFQNVDHLENEGFVRNCSERALIYARAAGNALAVVYAGP